MESVRFLLAACCFWFTCEQSILCLITHHFSIQATCINLHCSSPQLIVGTRALAACLMSFLIGCILAAMLQETGQAPLGLWPMPVGDHYPGATPPVPLPVVSIRQPVQNPMMGVLVGEVFIDQALICDLKVPVLFVGVVHHARQDLRQAFEVDQQHARVLVHVFPACCVPVHFWPDCHYFWLVHLAWVHLMVEHYISICVECKLLVDVLC